MEKIKEVYNNKILGVLALAVEVYISHLQLMSFMHYAVEPDETWDSDTMDYFQDSKKLALRLSQENFTAMYVLSAILVTIPFIVYLFFGAWLHKQNMAEDSKLTPMIWLIEHIIFGLGWVPIISQFADAQFCNFTLELESNNDIDCYEGSHTFLVVAGFIFVGFALIISVVPLAAFKSERKGIEERFGHDYYFPTLSKLLDVGVVFFLASVREPWMGFVLSLLVVIYLAVYICYKNPIVAALKMSVLLGQTWVFLSAMVASDDGDNGSQMLYAWPVFLILGAVGMFIRAKFIGSIPVHPIEK